MITPETSKKKGIVLKTSNTLDQNRTGVNIPEADPAPSTERQYVVVVVGLGVKVSCDCNPDPLLQALLLALSFIASWLALKSKTRRTVSKLDVHVSNCIADTAPGDTVNS